MVDVPVRAGSVGKSGVGLLFALVVAACAPGRPGGVPSPMATDSSQFAAVVTRYLEGGFESRPSDDPQWRFRTAAERAEVQEAARVLAALAAVDTVRLGEQDRVDWLLLEAQARRAPMDTVLRLGERMPSRYLTLGSLAWQVAGDRDPAPADWSRALRTLEQAPEAMAIGRARLVRPPPLWVDLAMSAADGYRDLLDGAFAERVGGAPDSLRDRLVAAAGKTQAALRAYTAFLRDTLPPGAATSWATGAPYYDWLLRDAHFLPYTAEQMIAEGYRVHEATKRELDSLAAVVEPGATWRELVTAMQARHPEPGQILAAYRGQSLRVLGFLIARDLIRIPPCQDLVYVATPPQLRETYAWGGYGGIDERDDVAVGRFFVTDVVPGMTPAEVDDKLRAQNDGWIAVIALHEGYPGHHLQQVYARANPRPLRRRLGSTYFGEGWALYAEHWMRREGLFDTDDQRLAQLQMRLWRTARVIVDPSLHTGRMSYDDAVRFFMDEVGLTRSAAEAEVNRYTTWPTQAPSYIIGWLEIEVLERELRQELGDRFDAKRFRETLLEQGSLPPALMRRAVREAMLGEK